MSIETVANELEIRIEGNDQQLAHALPDGESVMVGSASQCGIQIQDPTVAPRQCLLQQVDGELFVHDWSPDQPTTVNGQAVDPARPLQMTDVVEFGGFRLNWRPLGSSSPTPDHDVDSVPTSDHAPAPIAPVTAPQRSHEIDAAWDNDAFAESQPATSPEVASVQASTIELLTDEIESLQAELSEKNALIQQQQETAPVPVIDGDPELERRIEMLVVELDQSDQRVSAMEEVLRLSEEAQTAEQEEKRQLQQWVEDIEDRVAAREMETQAECELLRQKLSDVTEQREQDEGRLTQLLHDSVSDKNVQDMVDVLRHENETLRAKSQQLSEKLTELDQEVTQLRREATEESIQQRISEALRVERLELAQQRAALSRQQLELTSKTNELTQKVEQQTRANPADERFRVFREQLKELHAQEKQEYVAPSLTQKLVRIWQRLDGPTDTD